MFRALCVAACFALAPPLLTACTSIKDRTQSASAQGVELGGLWMTASFPCNGQLDTLLLGLEHKGRLLSASSTTQTACVARGRLLWTGMLPVLRVTPASLPVTLDVTVHLSGADDLEGEVSIITSDRMELRFEDAVVVMKRGAGSQEADDAEEQGGAGSSVKSSATAGGKAARAGVSGGHAASGNAGSRSVSSGGSKAPAAGSGGAGRDEAEAGSGGGGPDEAEAGSGGGADQADAGRGGAGEGAAKAGSGAPSRAAGTAGSSAPSSDPSQWFCTNVLDSCACVMNGAGAASCATKQPCCFSVRTFPTPNCQCWPADSDSCRTRDTDPDKEPVASCPP
jgi:hypothetical protein